MSIWDFDDRGAAEFQRAFELDQPPGLPEVGMFDRLGTSAAAGVGRGVVHLGEMLYNVGGLGIAAYEVARDHIGSRSRSPSGPKSGDILRPYQTITRRTTRNLLDMLTPNPETTGEASQVLGAAGEIIAPLLAGAGNPAPLVSGQINAAQDRLERQGVDPITARRAALTEGAIFALGARIPVLGNGLASRVGTGVAGNLALGVGGRAVESQVLQDYPEIAAQFDPLDPRAATIDALMGGVFGGITHALSPRAPALPRPVADAAAVVANARHADVETAPGVPLTPQAEAAHRRSLESKLVELMYDEPQAIDPTVIDAEFAPPADAVPFEVPIDYSVPAELSPVATATGRRVGVEYQVVELDTLVTSDAAGYPGELQPRDRSRVAMQDQVQNIAAALDPAQLGRSPVADTGAPIVGPDFVVESGNGRTMALRRAYDANGPRAQAYRDFLQGEGFNVSGMRRPVLVRVRRSELTPAERVAFTEEANVPTTATMSASERANIEARALDDRMLSLVEGSDYASARNAPFVAAFLEKLPVNLRNELVTDDGRVSLTGIKRIQAAMMTRAYGGSPEAQAVLERALESPQSDVRSIINGMLEAAPAFAKLRAEIAAGRVPESVDIGEALGRAVAEVQAIRDRRGSVAEYLAQQSLLDTDAAAAQIKALVSMFYNGERAASARKIGERLTAYAEQAEAQRLDQQTMFGPPEPDVMALVEQAKSETPIMDEADMAEPLDPVEAALQREWDEAWGNQVGEDVPEFGLTARQQLDLFPGLQIARVKAKRAAVALGDPPPTSKAKPTRPYSVLGNALAAEFRATGTASLLGHTLHTVHDLGRLIEAYRDPRFETFRMYFTDANGEIVHQTGVSGRVPGAANLIPDGISTDAFLAELLSAARNAGAVRFWMSHNHPSGNVGASAADVSVTRYLMNHFGRLGMDYGGHVISDTNHYNALEVNYRGDLREAVYPKAAGLARKYDADGAPVLDHPMLGSPLNNGGDLHNVASRVGTGPVMVGRGARGVVKFVAEVNISAMTIPRFRALVRKSARASGSVDVLFGNISAAHRAHLEAAFADGWIRDGMYADGAVPAWLSKAKPEPRARNAVREDDAPFSLEAEPRPERPVRTRGGADTVARGRIRRTISDLVTAAESQANWRTWYQRHEQTLVDLFGDDAPIFQKMLSATSQATGVGGNVSLALKAYGQWLNGEPFTGYLPAVVRNLERVRDDAALSGAKISQYGEANEGNTSAIAVDRHIASLLFNRTRPTAAQIASAKVRISKVAATLGWEPRQVQAALWAFNQVRKGTDPSKVASYDTILEARADFIAELRARHGRAEGTSLPAGRDAGAGAGEGTGAGAREAAALEAARESPAFKEYAELPEVQAATAVLGEGDFQVPTGRLLSNGKPETTSARALFDKTQQAIIAAEAEGKGFAAAAACALQGI